MANSVCLRPVGGTRARITKLDVCGAPVTGVGSCSIPFTGFVSVERTAEYADPNQFVVMDAGGRVCLKYRTEPQFLWYTFNINFCQVDPDIYALMSGSPVVLDATLPTPQSVGWRTRDSTLGTTNWALEIWTNLGDMACFGDPPLPAYGYWVAPWIHQGVVGSPTSFENGPVNFSIMNAKTNGGAGWGTGPYDVVMDALPAPSPLLVAMTAADHDHFQLTTVAPPAAVCGCETLAP